MDRAPRVQRLVGRIPFLDTPFNENTGQFSPDGRRRHFTWQKLPFLNPRVGAGSGHVAAVPQYFGAAWSGTVAASISSMSRSDRMLGLLGQTAREIGILIMVFAPLESAFAERAIDPNLLGTVILVSVLLIAGGILIETRE